MFDGVVQGFLGDPEQSQLSLWFHAGDVTYAYKTYMIGRILLCPTLMRFTHQPF